MKTMNNSNIMKSMVAAIVLCGMSINAQAQSQSYYDTKHEFGVSVGIGQNSQWMSALSDVGKSIGEILATSASTLGTMTSATTYENESSIPSISAEYFYHVNKVVGLGGIVGYSGSSKDAYGMFQDNVNHTTSKEKIGTYKKNYFTVMPAAKFDWLRKKNIGLYSKAALGVTYINEKQDVTKDGKTETKSDNRVKFNFQATLIGFEAGSQKVRGFAELGVGEQGIALAGIRCKF